MLPALNLVYIVNADAADDVARLDAVLASGTTALWLRAPDLSGAALTRVARRLRRTTRDAGAALIVGDRADVALAVEADGVQLGMRSPPAHRVRPWFKPWIGVSCHSAAELARAAEAGADYAVLSPIFGVPKKGAPLGVPRFQALVEASPLPVVGLGGVEPLTAPSVRSAGAIGVAVIRALRLAPDPAAASRLLCAVEAAR